MSEVSSVEIEHCKELAMPPGSLFEVSSRFITREQAVRLLAMYALRQSISLIPLSTMDDTVKWAKLKWWSEELCADESAPERHPVLRALYHSGARQRLDNSLLLRLVSDAVLQIDAFPEADSDDLIERLAGFSETDILMESALSDVTISDTLLKPMSQATGIYWLLVLLLNDYPNKTQLLPLDWLAEFQVKPADLKKPPPVPELINMVARLASQGAETFRAGFNAEDGKYLSQAPKHLHLRWALEARGLARIAKNAQRHFSQKSAYGLSDVWFAWRFCRRRSI